MFSSNKMKLAIQIGAVLFMLTLAIAPVLAAEDTVLDPGVDIVGQATGLGNKDLRETIGAIIRVALGFLGVIAVVVVLIGGFKYMTAGGSDDKVGEAKKWIISGIIGLAIILCAYAITHFVIDRLMQATTGTGLENID